MRHSSLDVCGAWAGERHESCQPRTLRHEPVAVQHGPIEMDPLEPLKVGWLQKKNSFRWSKRYFVLTRTTLAYYGSDDTRQNPKQSFALANARLIPPPAGSKNFSWILKGWCQTSLSNEDLTFHASDQNEYNDWHTRLTGAMAGANQRAPGQVQSRSAPPMPPQVPGQRPPQPHQQTQQPTQLFRSYTRMSKAIGQVSLRSVSAWSKSGELIESLMLSGARVNATQPT